MFRNVLGHVWNVLDSRPKTCSWFVTGASPAAPSRCRARRCTLPSEFSTFQALAADPVGPTRTWSAYSLYSVPIKINLCFIDEIVFHQTSCFSSVFQMQKLHWLTAPRLGLVTQFPIMQAVTIRVGDNGGPPSEWNPFVRCWNSQWWNSCCNMCDVPYYKLLIVFLSLILFLSCVA